MCARWSRRRLVTSPLTPYTLAPRPAPTSPSKGRPGAMAHRARAGAALLYAASVLLLLALTLSGERACSGLRWHLA